jgi:hypothetical protein
MSNTFDLEDLKDALDKEYAPLVLKLKGEAMVLRNLLRLGKGERSVVTKALAAVEANSGSEDEDESGSKGLEDVDALADAVEDILRVVPADGMGKKLVEFVNGDIAFAMKILTAWTEATQPGEAENSPA